MPKREKTTNELVNEIKQTNEIQKFIDGNTNEFSEKPLYETLGELIKDKKLKKSEVVKRSGLNRIYAYQIFAGKRIPSRDKLLALCFGFQLDLDETDRLLKTAGHSPLYARNKRDSIIIYAINSGKTVFITNDLLFENGYEILTS